MRIEHERRDAERKYGEPEIDEMGYPDRYRRVKQDKEVTHAHVDGWSCEAGIEDAEGYACCGKTSTGSDISCASESEIAQNGIGVNLGRENFEYERKRKEMFSESKECFACSSFHKF